MSKTNKALEHLRVALNALELASAELYGDNDSIDLHKLVRRAVDATDSATGAAQFEGDK